MHVYRRNRPIFELPDSHPAHRFLRSFLECRRDCVGKEITYEESDESIDQEWFSETDTKTWTFSGFAYMFLSFTVELDGWLTNAPELTESEKGTLTHLPYLRTLLSECESACTLYHNSKVLTMIHQVREMLELWEECIHARGREIEDPRNS